ncbi:MAG TPA: hypothetical protein VIU11_25785 [Nakamurella sp.]
MQRYRDWLPRYRDWLQRYRDGEDLDDEHGPDAANEDGEGPGVMAVRSDG